MACQSCRQHARLLARSLRPASSELSQASSSKAASSYPRPGSNTTPRASTRRHFSASAWRGSSDSKPIPTPSSGSGSGSQSAAAGLPKFAPGIGGQYLLTNQLDRLYKVCAAPAAYSISEELRLKDDVPKTEDGEELGTPQGPWLQTLNLSPSFSSWSHVTMLHMYLVVARMRCLDRDAARSTQAQFIDNFFFDCERVMHVNHGMTSSALRQRYLKDIFMQWRGLIAAYDEGVAKGSDRVLAAAVWRNLFKAREDVDFRHLAAVVAWMRATLRDLEYMDITEMISRGEYVFKQDLRSMLKLVDRPSEGMKDLYKTGEAAAEAEETTVKSTPEP